VACHFAKLACHLPPYPAALFLALLGRLSFPEMMVDDSGFVGYGEILEEKKGYPLARDPVFSGIILPYPTPVRSTGRFYAVSGI
jgi:hypothetical protein